MSHHRPQSVGMNQIIRPLTAFLTSNAIGYDTHPDHAIVRIRMQVESVFWHCFARQDRSGRFQMVSQVPDKTSPTASSACTELLARINSRLGFGHFEINYPESRLGFRTVVPLANGNDLGDSLIEHAFQTHLAVIPEFLPSFQAVLSGKQPPAAALQENIAAVTWS